MRFAFCSPSFFVSGDTAQIRNGTAVPWELCGIVLSQQLKNQIASYAEQDT